MLNKEIFPPHADITYESFFESAMQGTASSRLTPVTSLVIRRPLLGCQCCGTTLAVAYNHKNFRILLSTESRKVITSI